MQKLISLALMSVLLLPLMGAKPQAVFIGQNASLLVPAIVHTQNSNYSGCTFAAGAQTCIYALPNNPTSGNFLVVGANWNNGTLSSIVGTGTGCNAVTWTSVAATSVGGLTEQVWTAKANGTGSCTITIITATSSSGNVIGMTVFEVSGAAGLDSYGTNTSTSTSITVTANSPTTQANDLGLLFMATANSTTPTASGWSRLQWSNFDGGFSQSFPTSGTTASFVSSNVSAMRNAAVLLTLNP